MVVRSCELNGGVSMTNEEAITPLTDSIVVFYRPVPKIWWKPWTWLARNIREEHVLDENTPDYVLREIRFWHAQAERDSRGRRSSTVGARPSTR